MHTVRTQGSCTFAGPLLTVNPRNHHPACCGLLMQLHHQHATFSCPKSLKPRPVRPCRALRAMPVLPPHYGRRQLFLARGVSSSEQKADSSDENKAGQFETGWLSKWWSDLFRGIAAPAQLNAGSSAADKDPRPLHNSGNLSAAQRSLEYRSTLPVHK